MEKRYSRHSSFRKARTFCRAMDK